MNNIEISLFLVDQLERVLLNFDIIYTAKGKLTGNVFINTFPFKSVSDLLAIFFLGG